GVRAELDPSERGPRRLLLVVGPLAEGGRRLAHELAHLRPRLVALPTPELDRVVVARRGPADRGGGGVQQPPDVLEDGRATLRLRVCGHSPLRCQAAGPATSVARRHATRIESALPSVWLIRGDVHGAPAALTWRAASSS